jgi:hypothetical protein
VDIQPLDDLKTRYYLRLTWPSSGPHAQSIERSPVGTWRSLVAHLHGVQGVPSSNLGVPTNFFKDLRLLTQHPKSLGYS